VDKIAINLTAEEIRILISWYVFIDAMTSNYFKQNDNDLLEKLRAELRRVENEQEESKTIA